MLLSLHQKGTGKLISTGCKSIIINRSKVHAYICCDADGVSSLEVSSGGGTVIDGALQVCPGTTVSLTCSHDSTSDLIRWEIGAPIECIAFVAHSTNPSISLCGSFIINMVSAMNQPTRMSTLVLLVDQSLNGAVVTCFAGTLTSNPQAGNFTIQVIGEILDLLCTHMHACMGKMVNNNLLFHCRSSFHSNC